MQNTRRVALVTGASSGIGAEFARRLVRQGFELILVARRREQLDALARELGGAETLAADLTLEEDLARVEARIASAPDLELLVNNAGFGTKGRFWETPLDAQERMHRLHVMATLRLTRAALAGMVPRGRGGVINVSSVAGFGQSPGNVSYCATKAWMTSFTEGLDLELRGTGSPVRVQALCPGFTVTEFHDTMGMRREGIPAWLWMRAEDVVDQSLRGLEREKPIVVPGAIYKMVVTLERLVPRWLRSASVVRATRHAHRSKAA
ncbi:MAG: SDR family oxidoreductase [Candidatus Solibacter sp.]|nr:SDR family oxidoreductase [Candidatus Solibacter sp.]